MPTIDLVPPREWPTLGPLAVAWMEHYLCHGPGDVQGDPLYINEEAAQFVYDCYRLYPPDHPKAGRRIVTYGCLSEPKGFAKSELAGALSCFELVGPARFEGWKADGTPEGKPVVYPFIRPLATEEGQTGNTYGNIFVMLEYARDKFGSEWGFDRLDIAATRVLVGKNGKDGEVRPSTAGAASKDGGKETFSVADEPHLYVLPSLRSMHAMVRRNNRKRKEAEPWMLATTTMFEPGQQSVAEDLYDEAERLSKTERRNWGFCFHHREGFEVEDPTNDDEILNSLAEAYAPVLDHMDVDGILTEEFRAAGSVWAENVRYFLNRKHQGENKAIDPIKWDAQADPDKVVPDGAEVVLWFDGSDRGADADDTVLGLWTVEDVPHCVLLNWWATDGTPDYKVPRNSVRRAVTEARERYRVRRLVMDPAYWRDEQSAWEDEFGKVVEDGKHVDLVLGFEMSRASATGRAIDRFREAHHEGYFTHDGSARLRWYALNALLTRTGGRADYWQLGKPGLMDKIDGLVGAVIGYDELAELPPAPPAPEFFGGWA